MRITKVHIPELRNHGLKGIEMDRLGQTVVLAGKNGAGKSRLLNRLAVWPTSTVTRHLTSTFPQFRAEFGGFVKYGRTVDYLKAKQHAPYKDMLQLPKHWWHDEIHKATLEQHDRYVANNPAFEEYFELDFDRDDSPQIVPFIPKNKDLRDPSDLARTALNSSGAAAETVGVAHLEQHALGRIQVLQDREFNATHKNCKIPQPQRDEAISRYAALNHLVKRFLGVELTRSADGQAELFGRPIGRAGLSDGQKILLQFCVAVHAQADKLSELIVLMDEPENHLHPGAMLDVIIEIQKALPKGQLWIATHSVPLLAHFDPDCIWWMEDGSVQHVGSKPEMALRGLLGDDERIGKLGDFLGQPAALAATNFAQQCLLPPAVVNTTTDAQSQQIQRILNAHHPGAMLRLLDFGAGRGRLVSALREGEPNAEEVKARFDYRAFDALSEHRVECESAIARLYGTADNRYFTEEKDLLAALDAGSVDVVVMCNVLHEIDTEHWLPLFAQQGLLRRLLRPDGFLLLVEDMEMRIGEKAHQQGFLVLDTAELKTFFRIKEQEAGFAVDDARKDGRLKAHLVPARCLAHANHDSKRAALEQVKHLAKGEIKKLRKEPANYANGRKHAFHVQQLANAELALELAGV